MINKYLRILFTNTCQEGGDFLVFELLGHQLVMNLRGNLIVLICGKVIFCLSYILCNSKVYQHPVSKTVCEQCLCQNFDLLMMIIFLLKSRLKLLISYIFILIPALPFKYHCSLSPLLHSASQIWFYRLRQASFFYDHHSMPPFLYILKLIFFHYISI